MMWYTCYIVTLKKYIATPRLLMINDRTHLKSSLRSEAHLLIFKLQMDWLPLPTPTGQRVGCRNEHQVSRLHFFLLIEHLNHTMELPTILSPGMLIVQVSNEYVEDLIWKTPNTIQLCWVEQLQSYTSPIGQTYKRSLQIVRSFDASRVAYIELFYIKYIPIRF